MPLLLKPMTGSISTKIAQLAFARGTRLMLLYIPDFEGDELDEKARNWYDKYGTILDCGDLATRSTLFSNWAHLNHAGAIIVSDRIADAVAPQL